MMGARVGRVMLLAMALAASTLFVSAPAFSQALIRVGKAGREAFSFVPVDIGDRMGFFKKRGLTLEISSFSGDARLQQAMAADAIDMALASGVGMAFVAKGAPVKAVAAFADQPLLFAVVVAADSSVRSEADLKGRTVGVSGVNSVTQWLVNRISMKEGWGLGAIQVVGIGENAARVAAVQSHSIDGCVVDVASALNFAKSGKGRILARFGETVRDFHVHVMFATDKAIAEKPKAITSFIEGWFETVAFMRTNKAKSVEIAAEVMGTDVETASAIYDELMPMLSSQGRFNPKALDVLAKSFVELKMLPAEPDMSKLYTEALLPH